MSCARGPSTQVTTVKRTVGYKVAVTHPFEGGLVAATEVFWFDVLADVVSYVSFLDPRCAIKVTFVRKKVETEAIELPARE